MLKAISYRNTLNTFYVLNMTSAAEDKNAFGEIALQTKQINSAKFQF